MLRLVCTTGGDGVEAFLFIARGGMFVCLLSQCDRTTTGRDGPSIGSDVLRTARRRLYVGTPVPV